MSHASSLSEQYERSKTIIFATAQEAAVSLAAEVKALILSRAKEGKNVVLGLATGSTPVPFYQELRRLHIEEGLSFQNVISFNLDEYHGLDRGHRESYWQFMHGQLFDHIDMLPQNIHLPDGTVPLEDVFRHCEEYEAAIDAAGGIDLQILGIGRTGHIGFNEPGSSKDSRTRLVSLDHVTRRDAAADFLGETNVPHFAITMGVGTILRARKLVLMAWGENKAEIVRRAVEDGETDQVSASYLQSHTDARFLLNTSAAAQLTRVKLPWLVGSVRWSEPLARRAVGWLSGKLGKAILKLESEQYNENGMAELIAGYGGPYRLNIEMFNLQQRSITGWPGGKKLPDGVRAEAVELKRPVPATPEVKTVLILAPEPQDEILGMGGTLERLVDHGHTVTVAYQTTGDLRITDTEAARFAQVLRENAARQQGWEAQKAYAEDILSEIQRKGLFGVPSKELRFLKSLVRRGEARDAAEALDAAQTRFLDLPFYSNGYYRGFKLTDEDVSAMQALLEELKPDLIFTTGNLADPSSVQGLAFKAFRLAWEKVQKATWAGQCGIWLYRGQQKEYEPHEIEMAVPMSPGQLRKKSGALKKYQSQNVPGWSATGQNQETAQRYNQLGMAEYEAIEAFAKWQSQ